MKIGLIKPLGAKPLEARGEAASYVNKEFNDKKVLNLEACINPR